MAKMYKIKNPYYVEAFVFGVDEEPAWFRRRVEDGSIQYKYESNDFNKYVEMENFKEALRKSGHDVKESQGMRIIGFFMMQMPFDSGWNGCYVYKDPYDGIKFTDEKSFKKRFMPAAADAGKGDNT